MVVGSARDIVEQSGVPRFLFTDFPLGNPCGAPYDTGMQTAIVEMALQMLDWVRVPRTTVQTPYQWPTDDWRQEFMRFDNLTAEDLSGMGEDRRRRQAERDAQHRTAG